MSQPYTYPDPTLSLWQAAVAQVHRRRDSVQSRMATATSKRLAPPILLAEDDQMSPARLIGAALSAGEPVTPEMLSAPSAFAAQTKTAVALDCAKTAAAFL